jgi:diguanylate cyclase (GGDEF)-like protein
VPTFVKPFTIPASSRPDPGVLEHLGRLQRVSLVLSGAIGIVISTAWAIPSLRGLLPHGWNLMHADTALAILCCTVSLVLSQPMRSQRALRISRTLAAFVFLLAFIIYAESILHFTLPIDRFIDLATTGPDPGRMASQTSFGFLLLGLVLFFLRVRKRLLSHFVDLALFALGLDIMTIFSGYLFGALHLVAASAQIRSAPHSLVALCLLSFVAYGRRAEYGFHSILLGIGIGGKMARATVPFAIILPFVLESARRGVVLFNMVQPQYANAFAASVTSTFIVGFTVALAWRIDTLESRIQDLSLRDSLTGLYNRRGFYVLGEQALRLARRAGRPFSVVYLDLDHLKITNDTLGHEAGSQLIQVTGQMISQNFRETDVLGRIGGDEFVIAGEGDNPPMPEAVERLVQAVAARNALPESPYPVSFSFGCITEQSSTETLEQMLGRADKLMYEAKRTRKSAS